MTEETTDSILEELIKSTGLPADLVMAEMTRLLKESGVDDPERATLEQLREALMLYLLDLDSEVRGVEIQKIL